MSLGSHCICHHQSNIAAQVRQQQDCPGHVLLQLLYRTMEQGGVRRGQEAVNQLLKEGSQ